jgi:small subunit ribosomal protein S21
MRLSILHSFTKGGDYMSTVYVKENENLDSAIRRWKKKCANDGIIGDLRRKEHYEKPSVRKKKKLEVARKRMYK